MRPDSVYVFQGSRGSVHSSSRPRAAGSRLGGTRKTIGLCPYRWLWPNEPIETEVNYRDTQSDQSETGSHLRTPYRPHGIRGHPRSEFDVFIRLAKDLAEAFVAERIDYVAGDAAEGCSPTHDICRLIINAEVKIAYQRTGQAVANFEFALVRPPDADLAALHPDDIWLQLDESGYAEKHHSKL